MIAMLTYGTPGWVEVSSSPIGITGAFSAGWRASANPAWREPSGPAPVRRVPCPARDAGLEVLRTRATSRRAAALAAPGAPSRVPRNARGLRVRRRRPARWRAAQGRAHRGAVRDAAGRLRAWPHSGLAALHVPGRRLRRGSARGTPRGSGGELRPRARPSRAVRTAPDVLQRGGRRTLRPTASSGVRGPLVARL